MAKCQHSFTVQHAKSSPGSLPAERSFSVTASQLNVTALTSSCCSDAAITKGVKDPVGCSAAARPYGLADPMGCSAAAMTEGLAEPDLPQSTGKCAMLSLRPTVCRARHKTAGCVLQPPTELQVNLFRISLRILRHSLASVAAAVVKVTCCSSGVCSKDIVPCDTCQQGSVTGLCEGQLHAAGFKVYLSLCMVLHLCHSAQISVSVRCAETLLAYA